MTKDYKETYKNRKLFKSDDPANKIKSKETKSKKYWLQFHWKLAKNNKNFELKSNSFQFKDQVIQSSTQKALAPDSDRVFRRTKKNSKAQSTTSIWTLICE